MADYGRIYDHYGFLLFVGHYFEAQIPRFKWPDSKKSDIIIHAQTHEKTSESNQIKPTKDLTVSQSSHQRGQEN